MEFKQYYGFKCCVVSVLLLCFLQVNGNSLSFVRSNEQLDAMDYLRRYGYLNESFSLTHVRDSDAYDSVTEAIIDFQDFAGIDKTGVLDTLTLHLMSLPRCGVKDRRQNSDGSLASFSLQGSKWHKRRLTYRIVKYSNQISREETDREIKRAFQVWSEVTPLQFETVRSGQVDIEIRFETARHNDNYPFDGPGGTLAHAYFPQFGGDAHFDDGERWTISTFRGINLFQVAAHEFGHSLGLEHSEVQQALMAPFYKGYQPNFRLDEDDVDAIQTLYGNKNDFDPRPTPAPVPKPTPSPPSTPDSGIPSEDPNLCRNPKIDAIADIKGETYVFQGSKYWKLGANSVRPGYPKSIGEDFEGLPSDLDAAVSLPTLAGRTYFFKGKYYWRSDGFQMTKGYPKLISKGFRGIPDDLDGAFVWSNRNILVFFKGTKYWRFDLYGKPQVPKGYPKNISIWRGIPTNIDGAFQYSNGKTYFFKDRYYWKFNDEKFEAEQSYPKPIGVNWYGCQ